MLKSNLSAYSKTLTVDTAGRRICGATAVSKGATVDGRFDFTDENLKEFLSAFQKAEPVKSQFGHHETGGSQSALAVAGFAKNFRLDGDRVICDLELAESASLSPLFQRDPVPALLAQAQECPEDFGLSPAFYYDKTENGVRVAEVLSIDLVGLPASNLCGLLAAQTEGGQKMADEKTPEQLMREKVVTELLAFQTAFVDPGFVLEMFLAGKTLEEAQMEDAKRKEEKAKLELEEMAKTAQAEVAVMSAKVKELEAKLSAAQTKPAQTFAQPVKIGDVKVHANFRAAVLSIQNEEKCDRIQAAKLASDRFPELLSAATQDAKSKR